jgi:hypothetical protein
MTFDENGADREPPQLGGFFIEILPLRSSASSALMMLF